MVMSRARKRWIATGSCGAGRPSGEGRRNFHIGKAVIPVFFFVISVSAAPALAPMQGIIAGDDAAEAHDDIGGLKPDGGAAGSMQSSSADGAGQETLPKTDPATAQNPNAQKQEKKGEWVAAPIPISSPAIGTGLEWAVAYVFPFNKQDKVSPHSVLGVGGLFTNNGSRGLGIGGRLYFKEDKYRLTAAGGGAKINADIYGIGKEAGDRGLYLPLTAEGSGFLAEPLFAVRKGVYLGARFQHRNVSLSVNKEDLDLPADGDLPPALEEIEGEIADFFKQRTVSLGPRFQWDTRDDKYYPLAGIFLDSGIDFFADALGSKWTYQYSKIAFNKYTSVGKGQILAVRGMGCAATGDHVPIYDLCLFGTGSDLRGYPGGRYQDRRMFATQAEYRLNMTSQNFLGRFGVVAFGGFGGVGRTFGDIGWGDLLPAGGGGLRFRLTKKDRINFRIDYGIGRVGNTLSMGIGEAF